MSAARGTRPTSVSPHVEVVDDASAWAEVIRLGAHDERAMIAAHLLGVDAFDQPAVEEGKALARAYLAGGAP